MIYHVYPHKGAAYKALKEFIKHTPAVSELVREELSFVRHGVKHQFIWRKGVEYPYTYWSSDA